MKDFLPADFFWRNIESPVKPFSLHEKPYHKSGFQKMSRIPHALKEAAFFWRVPESQGEVFVRFLCMPDKLIAARGEFSLSNRGRGGEDPEALAARKAVWEKNS